MTFMWSKQPLKAILIIFLLLKTAALFPWLLIRYFLKSSRPFPEWSLKLCIINPLVRQLLAYYVYTRSDAMSSVISDHQKAKERHSLAAPAETNLYSGVITPGVAKPAAVGGLWYPAPLHEGSPNFDDEKVVLHFPGGAFVLAWGQETSGRVVAKAMSRYLKATRTFYAQYRPSVDNTTRFPAAVQDLVTFYNYILSLGVNPQNVILSGDSAAGNLVIALLRYLETSSSLPLPGGAMVWSPWVHVTSKAGADYDASRNSASDSLVASLLQWGAQAYFPEHRPTAEEVAYISPLHHPFRTRVPLFIHGGTTEAMFDTIEEFAEQMTAIDNNVIRFHPTEFISHNLIMAYEGVGLEREVESALVDAYNFFKQ
ncbi:Alpha/Beta hydrolase protein [Annulohypoxylon maeteangense]|uniref:Alpha/Beta hydrolase protein n=1 Tax=Annulohypoxylon maeteangense TaxID=1927788 RepID=UPI002007C296|nr:Alpha/Beta hydrolase protein [Annulohypoxylon maeteangense]KAI0882552.1 Alpha/Beta hydrolase protein [Annulohypoxylon maeteangense]